MWHSGTWMRDHPWWQSTLFLRPVLMKPFPSYFYELLISRPLLMKPLPSTFHELLISRPLLMKPFPSYFHELLISRPLLMKPFHSYSHELRLLLMKNLPSYSHELLISRPLLIKPFPSYSHELLLPRLLLMKLSHPSLRPVLNIARSRLRRKYLWWLGQAFTKSFLHQSRLRRKYLWWLGPAFTKSFLHQSTSPVLLCKVVCWSVRSWLHCSFNWLVSSWCHRSKTHKRLKERFLIRQNKTKRAHFFRKSSFSSYVQKNKNKKNQQQKNKQFNLSCVSWMWEARELLVFLFFGCM